MFMVYGYLSGQKLPECDVTVSVAHAVGGQAVGILVIDAWYPMLPGNVANATTYNFPVVYKVLKGVSVAQILSVDLDDPVLLDPIIDGGKELIGQGVRAIVGACGSFANYQKEAAEALDVPTFLSVMLQAPLILQGLRAQQKLGVIVASKSAMTERIFDQCDIANPSRLILSEVITLPEFQRMMECKGRFDSRKLQQELVSHIEEFIKEQENIGAILLQCSDLPPYAWAIQRAIRLPVFDMNSLIEWVHYALVRRPYKGFI